MLKITYRYSGKEFKLQPYNTAQEKDLLLLSVVGEENLDTALEICNVSKEIIDSLTEDEKIAMLYKFREISVGAEINIRFKCTVCGAINENIINIENLVESGSVKNDLIIDAFKRCTDENIQDFIKVDVEELDLDEYEKLIQEVKNSVTKFNFIRQTHCQKCKNINNIAIDDKKFVIENMSEDSLTSLYQTYNNLIFYGNYTKTDIDSLYPFERTILISLLNKTREEINK